MGSTSVTPPRPTAASAPARPAATWRPDAAVRPALPGEGALVAKAFRATWTGLLEREPRLASLYPPGDYGRAEWYDPEIVPVFALLAGAAGMTDAVLTRCAEDLLLRADVRAVVGCGATRSDGACLVASLEKLRWTPEIHGSIEFAYVPPTARGSGIAEGLVAEAREFFMESGCRRAWGFLLERNDQRLAFWERVGATPWGRLMLHEFRPETRP